LDYERKILMNRLSKYAVSTIVASAIAVVPISAAFGVKKCLPDLCDLGSATPHEPIAMTATSTSS